MSWVIAAIFLATAIGTTICAWQTRPDRNYWPMLRVIWAALAFTYGGGAIAAIIGGNRSPVTRLAFSAAILVAVAYSVWFMRKRNRTPRFVGLAIDGTPTMVGLDEIERAATLVDSAAHHGVLPAKCVADLEASLPEWHRKDEWRRDLANQVARRRRGE